MLVAQGDLAEALASYRASLAICGAAGQGRPRQRRLAARSLGVVREDRRRAGGAGQPDRGAASLPRLPRHPGAAGQGRSGNAGWQRDLSVATTSRRRAGGAGQSAGSAEDATAQARHHRTAGQGRPSNAGWQRDLSVSHANLALAYRREGRIADALAALHKARNIISTLAARAPNHAGWQRDLAWLDRQIAGLEEKAPSTPR